MQVFIVIGITIDSEGWEHCTTPIKVFSTRENADRFVDPLNKEIKVYYSRLSSWKEANAHRIGAHCNTTEFASNLSILFHELFLDINFNFVPNELKIIEMQVVQVYNEN